MGAAVDALAPADIAGAFKTTGATRLVAQRFDSSRARTLRLVDAEHQAGTMCTSKWRR